MTKSKKATKRRKGQSASKAMLGFPVWLDAFDGNVPSMKWILVKNTAGFMAAVNEVVFNNTTREFSGYVLTPEREEKVISCITHWAKIRT